MWGTVLVFALLTANDPARLGIAVILISRPRRLHNLLAYWLGGMAASIAAGLGVLILLRDSLPMVMRDVTSTDSAGLGHGVVRPLPFSSCANAATRAPSL